MEIKLIDLVNKIVDESKDSWIRNDKERIIKEWYLKTLNIIGESNLHIPDFNYDRGVEERSEEDNNLLTGEENIKGNFLVYWCSGHDGFEIIREYETIEEVEDFILNFHDNGFINQIIVFEDGMIKDWKIEGPPNTSEIIQEEDIDGVLHSIMKITIHANVKWLN